MTRLYYINFMNQAMKIIPFLNREMLYLGVKGFAVFALINKHIEYEVKVGWWPYTILLVILCPMNFVFVWPYTSFMTCGAPL